MLTNKHCESYRKFTNEWGNTYSVIAVPNSGIFQYEYETDMGSNIEELFLEKTGRWVYGISHLIEHMSFKSPKDMSTEELMEALKTEGSYNAYTDKTCINYYYSTISELAKTAVTLTLNVATNDLTRVNAAEFESEKSVVANEIRRYQDDPQSIFSFNTTAVIYGRNKDDNILGNADLLENFTLHDCVTIKAIFQQHANVVHRIIYDPVDIELDDIISFIESEQERLKPIISNTFTMERCEYDESQERDMVSLGQTLTIPSESNMQLITIVIPHEKFGFEQVPQTVANFIGYKAKTSLNEIIREKHGLTYGISFYHQQTTSDQDLYVFSVDVPTEHYDKTIQLFTEAISSSSNEFDDTSFQNLQKQYNIAVANANLNRKVIYGMHSFDKNPGWEEYRDGMAEDYISTRKKIAEDVRTFDNFQQAILELKTNVENGKFLIVRN